MAFGFNVAIFLTTMCLVVTWVMMAYAISRPSWSSSDVLQAGLWRTCQWRYFTAFDCISLPPPVAHDGFLIAACAFTISGAVLALLASLLSCVNSWVVHFSVGGTLSCLCAVCWVLLSLGWGMWLGVHNKYYGPLGWDLDFAFALCCACSVLCFVGIFTSLCGIWVFKRHKRALEDRMAADIDFPDGVGPADHDSTVPPGTPEPSDPRACRDFQSNDATFCSA